MTTWILIIYMTSGIGYASTGGPMSVDGFTSVEKCYEAKKIFESSSFKSKIDMMDCIPVKK